MANFEERMLKLRGKGGLKVPKGRVAKIQEYVKLDAHVGNSSSLRGDKLSPSEKPAKRRHEEGPEDGVY